MATWFRSTVSNMIYIVQLNIIKIAFQKSKAWLLFCCGHRWNVPHREICCEVTWQLIDFARMYLRLGELEEATKEGGRLRVHIGDAFGPGVSVEGGFAGEVWDTS